MQRLHILFATARKGQVGDLVALIFPVLNRDGVEGRVLGCEDEAGRRGGGWDQENFIARWKDFVWVRAIDCGWGLW